LVDYCETLFCSEIHMSGIEEIETEVNTCMEKSSSFINPFE